MNKLLRNALLAGGLAAACQASAQVTFYQGENFSGRPLTAEGTTPNFARLDYNNVASSAVVHGGAWEVCTRERFEGRCVVLRPGDYPSLRELGLDRSISSAREIDRDSVAAAPLPGDAFPSSPDVFPSGPDAYPTAPDAFLSAPADAYDYPADRWRYDRWAGRWERY
jgi:hypothetical protein